MDDNLFKLTDFTDGHVHSVVISPIPTGIEDGIENGIGASVPPVNDGLPPQQHGIRPERTFKARHIQMMALGSPLSFPTLIMTGVSIGSGLLYQSGIQLASSGPVSLLLAYIFMGTVVYSVLVHL